MKRLMAFIVCILIAHTHVLAQGCSMCTATAGNLSQDKAAGLNTGIVYLALMPLTLILSIGIWWYKRNRGSI